MNDDLIDIHPGRQRIALAAVALLTVPAFLVRYGGLDASHALEALLFGLAIVGAAFAISWAAETAQLDISAGLAIAILALIAVLPEYAVDFVFTAQGGNSYQLDPSCPSPLGPGRESPCDLALANMTGANRLLIGLGWSMVVFIAWYRLRRTRQLPPGRWKGIQLTRDHSIELGFLWVATLYSLTLPLKASITLIDTIVLVALFAGYTWRVSRAPAEEPHLVGPARYLGTFPVVTRRVSVIGLFLASGVVILLFAEPFAHSLQEAGKQLGISEFLLVQWLAPLASESPELLVAGLFAWRLNTNAGLGTLVSSKVNQWTLLVGTLPIVFAISSASTHGLPISAVQREELFLTAAQSFFAVAILSNLSLSLREAGYLFGLFWAQFIVGALVPESMHAAERIGVGILYLLLGVAFILRDRRRVPQLVRDAFVASYAELGEERLQDALEEAEGDHPSPPHDDPSPDDPPDEDPPTAPSR
ncbi:MAG: Sodium/calcium exchanger family protein [Actinomycetia bacterium]|nr:Sodium/calcium exchanger family protein [Actinomycetes bacterium]